MRTRKARGNKYLIGKSVSYLRIKNKLIPFDTEDFNLVRPYTWYISSNNYVVSNTLRRTTGRPLVFHRLIMNTSENQVVDHLDGDRFNNRKINLRNCTHQDNNYNRETSGEYRGVSYCKQRKMYKARIKRNYKSIHLGYYTTPQEAHNVYLDYIKNNNIVIR